MNVAELEKLLAETTPGPWEKDKYSQLRSPSGKQIGTWDAGISWVSRDRESEANARLIAMSHTLARRVIAAEKLVEALREIECHDDGTIDLYSPNEIATNALTAYEATK